MTKIPDALCGDRELQVVRVSEGKVELRHLWMPYNPPLVFALLLAAGTLTFLLMLGWPHSWEALSLEAVLLVLIGYAAAALSFNATYLVVTPTRLCWRYGPLPWRPGGWVAAEDVRACTYGRVCRTTTRTELVRQSRVNSARPQYALSVCLHRTGGEIRLCDSLLEERATAAAAQLLAEALGGVPVERGEQSPRALLPQNWVLAPLLGLLALLGLLGLLLVTLLTAHPRAMEGLNAVGTPAHSSRVRASRGGDSETPREESGQRTDRSRE